MEECFELIKCFEVIQILLRKLHCLGDSLKNFQNYKNL